MITGIKSSTNISFGLVISLVSAIGGVGSAVVSYAVTNATLQAESSATKERLDHDRGQREQMQHDIVEIKVSVARIEGIVSELKEAKTSAKR